MIFLCKNDLNYDENAIAASRPGGGVGVRGRI